MHHPDPQGSKSAPPEPGPESQAPREDELTAPLGGQPTSRILTGPGGLLQENEILGGRYRLLGLIGIGGMGSVYRAHDSELEEEVALKMLRPELVKVPEMLERFRREVKLARRVTHHNVARVYDIGEHGGERFLTMELIEGESLGARMRLLPGPMEVREIIDIARALCAGLEAAHAAGVLHRDLKPENVLIDARGHRSRSDIPGGLRGAHHNLQGARVVITDFGIARALVSHERRRTVSGPTGTPAYMAPEQVEGAESIDARADLYSLGVMLYELATGDVPWRGSSDFMVATARLGSPPPDPRHLRSDLPEELSRIILRCLARYPQDRYASAAELGADLGRLVPPSAAAPEPNQPPPAPLHPVLAAPERLKTIAILPFRNAGPPEDEYLADGLMDDLIDHLSMIAGLRVRPRSSVVQYKGGERDPREFGRELGVQVVAEGTLRRTRGAGDLLHISTRLISVADGFQLWAKRFDRPAAEVLAVGEEAARAIADALTVAPARALRGAPGDPVALDLYLRGRFEYHHLGRERVRRAIALFKEALERAPDDPAILAFYALASVRLWFIGDTEFALSREQAQQAAERAVAAGPQLGEPHVALASVYLHSGEPGPAVRELRRALVLAPGLVEAHDNLGRLLIEAGRIEEGIQHIRTALAIQPTLILPRWELARAHALLGQWDEVDHLREIQLTPGSGEHVGHWFTQIRMAIWRRDRGRMNELLEALPYTDPAKVQALISLSRNEWPSPEALEQVGPLDSTPNIGRRRQAFMLQLKTEFAAFLPDAEITFRYLTASIDAGMFDLAWIDHCPLFAPLRQDPRFLAQRARVEERIQPVLEAMALPAG
jgi:serine/threonine protein kinase